MTARPMTMAEKVLARTSGRDTVSPGDIVVCRPDQVVQIDINFAVDGLWYRPRELFDRDKVALIFDHAVPAPTVADAAGMREGRAFAEQFGLANFFDVGRHGIVHIVLAEQGLARPGELLICGDSHSSASGALNCAARAAGAVDILQAMTKGVVWFPVVPTIRYEFEGRLPSWSSGKDVFFEIARRWGDHSNHNIEFGGALDALAMSDRRTIATMSTELNAEFVLFEHDDQTADYLRAHDPGSVGPVFADAGARYADVRTIRLDEIEPAVVLPHGVLGNVRALSELQEGIRIDQAFVGSCANGNIEDLRIVSSYLEGRKVAPGVRFIVTPASQRVYAQALEEGLFVAMIEAGAIVTNATCGACFGYHMGVLAPGEICITASTRNFRGRMGSPEASIYIASPATVAASAVAGTIVGPHHD